MTDDQNTNNIIKTTDPTITCVAVPKSAIAGTLPNTTQPVFCYRCNIHVTSAPEQIYGNVNYYYDLSKNVAGSGFKSRHFDFLARHIDCGHNVPEYYLSYGDKYIKKFTTELYPKLSQAGKNWLVSARQKLQEYMEKGFEQNIKNTIIIIQHTDSHDEFTFEDATDHECLELDNKLFKDFAFWTHPPAYIDGGFYTLTANDKFEVMKTVEDGGDLWSWDTVAQMWHTGRQEVQYGKSGSTSNSFESAVQFVSDKNLKANREIVNTMNGIKN